MNRDQDLSSVKLDLEEIQYQDELLMQQLLDISKTILKVSKISRSSSRLTVGAYTFHDMNDRHNQELCEEYRDESESISSLEEVTRSVEDMSLGEESDNSCNGDELGSEYESDRDEYISSSRSLPNINLSSRRLKICCAPLQGNHVINNDDER